MKYNLITILGPTATGKTALAAKLALYFNGEIISADSRQVYTGMDLGTGKDIKDYCIEGINIPYYMIDIISPNEEFNLFDFNNRFYEYFGVIRAKNKIPFLAGGSSLYLDSIIRNYKLVPVNFDSEEYRTLENQSIEELKTKLLSIAPNLHNSTDLVNKERLIKAIIIHSANQEEITGNKEKINSLIIGIRLPNDIIKKRINARLKQRLTEGMIDETKALIDKGLTLNKLLFFGLEYKYLGMYLFNQLNYNDMFQKLNSAIYQFARKQIKWFSKMEREGINIHWIDGADFEKAKEIIKLNYFSSNL